MAQVLRGKMVGGVVSERNLEEMVSSLAGLPGVEAGAALAERVTGMPRRELEAVLLGAVAVPDRLSARRLVDWTAALLRLPRSEAARVLGVSASRLRRNNRVPLGMLDRVVTLCETWMLASRVIGADGAAHWFLEPHPSLEGATPAACLATGYGQQRLRSSVWSALNGAPA